MGVAQPWPHYQSKYFIVEFPVTATMTVTVTATTTTTTKTKTVTRNDDENDDARRSRETEMPPDRNRDVKKARLPCANKAARIPLTLSLSSPRLSVLSISAPTIVDENDDDRCQSVASRARPVDCEK